MRLPCYSENKRYGSNTLLYIATKPTSLGSPRPYMNAETWTGPLIQRSKVFGLTYTQQTSLTSTPCGRSLVYSVVLFFRWPNFRNIISNKQQTLLFFHENRPRRPVGQLNPYAKIMQTSGKRTCSQFPECSLSYAKIMQTSGKRTCSQFPECSLSYAKIMQTSGKRTCSQFPECSLSYAKIKRKTKRRKRAARKVAKH